MDRFELAKIWLKRCSVSHENCRNQRQHRRPTRLVSLGNDAVRLVLAENLQTMPEYATLSYCWGLEPVTKLTSSNLRSFMDHIPMGDLPRTLVDAIDAARQLGLQYIWIDALCIIQDDILKPNGDWAKEAGNMASVYGGAHVNLAATTASGVHQGFLRNPQGPDGFVAEVTTAECCRVQDFYSPNVIEKAVTKTHLAKRA